MNRRKYGFETELAVFLSRFEPYAKRYFLGKIRSSAEYSPLMAQFYRDLADFSARGKRMRGFLVWLGYRLAGGVDLQKILPISLALEIFHSFLLIHDDIIDKSDTRRGKPTIHRRYEKKFGSHYGTSQAIVIGDIACFGAFGLVTDSDFDPEVKIKCLSELVKVLLETGFGEALDVEYSYRVGTLPAVWKMTELKTAGYSFIGPLAVGATLGKVSVAGGRAISGFGKNVGLAFQIQDDILGVFGKEKVIGKSVLSDMREGKNTILIYKARDLANSGQRSRLAKLWGKRDGSNRDLDEIREILVASGALAWCRRENQRLVEKSKEYISTITSDRRLGRIFAEIADFVIAREK